MDDAHLTEVSKFPGSYRFQWAQHCCYADASGALFIEEPQMLVVSDLHLEKASHFAAKGQFLPPYDSEKTLKKLQTSIELFKPKTVISLGDSFHDSKGRSRLSAINLQSLKRITQSIEFVWVVGNHDADEIQDGTINIWIELEKAGICFVHEGDKPAQFLDRLEISGHFHPCATIKQRGRRMRRRCFAFDKRRMIMPAFGSLTGSLNITDPVYDLLFNKEDLSVVLLGERSAHRFPYSACCKSQ